MTTVGMVRMPLSKRRKDAKPYRPPRLQPTTGADVEAATEFLVALMDADRSTAEALARRPNAGDLLLGVALVAVKSGLDAYGEELRERLGDRAWQSEVEALQAELVRGWLS